MHDPEIYIPKRQWTPPSKTGSSWWMGQNRSDFYSEIKRLFDLNKPEKLIPGYHWDEKPDYKDKAKRGGQTTRNSRANAGKRAA